MCYRVTTCRERELTLDHIILFWPHNGKEGLSGWGISSVPEPPPRQHEHERLYTPFKHPFILTRRIWKDDYHGRIIFVDLVGLKLTDICLIGEENPRKKTSPRKLIPTWDRTGARCVTGAHVSAFSTAVDNIKIHVTKYIRYCKY